jgi:hypothetical protein
MGSEIELANALAGSMKDFRHIPGSNRLGRVQAFSQWQQLRRQAG